MVRVLRLKKEQAQKAKEYLQQKGWFAANIVVGRSAQRYVLLPLNEKVKEADLLKKFSPATIETRNLKPQAPTSGNLKYLLRDVVPEEKVDEIIRSYDVVGDICILEIPEDLQQFELTIGHAIKRAFPNIKVVARKNGKRTEIERVMPLKIITGEKRLTTIHKEHGVSMKIDLSKVYFSPRASAERLRLAQLVKPHEKILVMFSGICPYALVIAKMQPNCSIWAVELNEDAHKLAEENARLNRLSHLVYPILGDVAKEVPKIGEKFDRIIMPFPEKDWDYLDLALRYAASGGMIHAVFFVEEGKLDEVRKKILGIANRVNQKVQIKNWHIMGSYSPGSNRYTFDILVK